MMEKFPTEYVSVLNIKAIKIAMQEQSGSIAQFCAGLETITYNGLIKGLSGGTLGLRTISEILWKLPGQPADYMLQRPGTAQPTGHASEPATPYGTEQQGPRSANTEQLIREQNRLIRHLSAELNTLRKEVTKRAKNQRGNG